MCVSSVDTGSRLTCITVLWPQQGPDEMEAVGASVESSRKRTLDIHDRKTKSISKKKSKKMDG